MLCQVGFASHRFSDFIHLHSLLWHPFSLPQHFRPPKAILHTETFYAQRLYQLQDYIQRVAHRAAELEADGDVAVAAGRGALTDFLGVDADNLRRAFFRRQRDRKLGPVKEVSEAQYAQKKVHHRQQ